MKINNNKNNKPPLHKFNKRQELVSEFVLNRIHLFLYFLLRNISFLFNNI